MITLYYAPDNASLIIRILLEEIGASYQTALVDRSKQQQSSKMYRQLNPSGLIPVCVIDDCAVFETAAIALILTEKFDNQFAVAADSLEEGGARGDFLKWLFFLSNSLHTDLRMLFYPTKYAGDAYTDDAEDQFNRMTRVRLLERLQMFENQIEASGSGYVLGKLTVIDFYLAVCLRWLQLYPSDNAGWLDLSQFPCLLSLVQSLESRPATLKACLQEGIEGKFFSAAKYAQPFEGVAL